MDKWTLVVMETMDYMGNGCHGNMDYVDNRLSHAEWIR